MIINCILEGIIINIPCSEIPIVQLQQGCSNGFKLISGQSLAAAESSSLPTARMGMFQGASTADVTPDTAQQQKHKY